MELTKKELYTLEQLKLRDNSVEVEFELDVDLLNMAKELAAEKGITLSELINLTLIKKIVEIKTAEDSDFENKIDIFDFYRIESIIDEQKKFLVINPLGENVVLLPKEEANELLGDKLNG